MQWTVNNGTFPDAERAPLASAPDAERAILVVLVLVVVLVKGVKQSQLLVRDSD